MNEKLFNPDYLFSLCQNYGLRPSKEYGQNYLFNPEPIEMMLAAAAINQDDTVIEVGPGWGGLTFALTEKAKKVIAFEIEKKLEKYWADRSLENLEIVWGNVLREVENHPAIISLKSYKVVANLPYQITSSVIRKFLESDRSPTVMVLMVQKEVGERICAQPGGMSLLSVAVQYYAKPEIVVGVARNNFWPEPKVDSAVIRLSSYQVKKSTAETKIFFDIVKLGFANRRKLLIKNLSSLANKSELNEIFIKIGLLPTVRAQELSVGDWRKLIGYLSDSKT
ncbi:MAG: 16S rRNA (adenine(1518)-N(6)/adenine(1519)-N(6))-dimethyltransferase RsmA [Candidatus Magasanikbacteria bacterium]